MRRIFLTLLAAVIGIAQMNAQTIVDTWQIGSPNATDVTAKFSAKSYQSTETVIVQRDLQKVFLNSCTIQKFHLHLRRKFK